MVRLPAKVGAIEFVGDEVRLAIVKTGGRLPKVLELHVCRAEYAAPEQRFEAMVAAVQSAAGKVRTRPSLYVLCVSSFYSVVRTLTIPFRGARRVGAAVPFELERYLAFPIEELVVDSATISEAKGQTEVLAAGMRRDVLADLLAILNAAGIDPEGVDVDAAGLTSLWHACQPPLKGLHAVLHARESGSILAVTWNRTLVYFRHLDLSADQIREDAAAAAREVQNSLRAFHANWKDEGSVASLTITGVDLGAEADALFKEEFEIPVTYLDLLAQLPGTPQPGRSAASTPDGEEITEAGLAPPNGWEAAIGAALGASGGGCSMNFRQGDLAPANTLRSLVPHVLFTSCVAVVLLAGVAWYCYDARARNLAEAARLEEQIEAVEKDVKDLQGQGISVAAEAFSDPNLLDILADVAARMPDSKATVTELKVEPSGAQTPWVTITGEVKDDTQFAAAVAALRESSILAIDEPELKLVGGRSTFKITARRVEGAVARE